MKNQWAISILRKLSKNALWHLSWLHRRTKCDFISVITEVLARKTMQYSLWKIAYEMIIKNV